MFGTDGSGAKQLIVPAGGQRLRAIPESLPERLAAKQVPPESYSRMDGPGIFSFAINRVPPMIDQLLQAAGRTRDDVDLFVFHQANAFMLEALRTTLAIPRERFVTEFAEAGNTVSSTIPIVPPRSCGEKAIESRHQGYVGRVWRGVVLGINSRHAAGPFCT